jgi:hypothetical protein
MWMNSHTKSWTSTIEKQSSVSEIPTGIRQVRRRLLRANYLRFKLRAVRLAREAGMNVLRQPKSAQWLADESLDNQID